MKIKSRFTLKKGGVLLDIKISDFGWKGVFFLPRIREKSPAYFSSLGTSVVYVLVGSGGDGASDIYLN